MTQSTEKAEDKITFHKAGFDSRIPFSRYLVELKEVLLRSTDNIENWMYALRLFHSNMQGLSHPTKLKEWKDKYKIVYSKYTTSKSNRGNGVNYNPEQDLFDLQDELFELTAPLYLPISDEDADDELDLDAIFGEEK